jgi:hypothetical protein
MSTLVMKFDPSEFYKKFKKENKAWWLNFATELNSCFVENVLKVEVHSKSTKDDIYNAIEFWYLTFKNSPVDSYVSTDAIIKFRALTEEIISDGEQVGVTVESSHQVEEKKVNESKANECEEGESKDDHHEKVADIIALQDTMIATYSECKPKFYNNRAYLF